MPFDANDPNTWINEITENEPLFIRSLCRYLFFENGLVRQPVRKMVCYWGMTSEGRAQCGSDVPEVFLDWFLSHSPDDGESHLPPDDVEYQELVRQEDPEALNPDAGNFWAFAVAAFKYGGGNIPQTAAGAEKWELIHLYEILTRLSPDNRDDTPGAVNHFTQSAALVAVHPVVYHLKREHPCIVTTLQARAFTKFRYDPKRCFAPNADHNNCGFACDPA